MDFSKSWFLRTLLGRPVGRTTRHGISGPDGSPPLLEWEESWKNASNALFPTKMHIGVVVTIINPF